MKAYSTHQSTTGLIVCACLLTIAVLCGISLVEGQDVAATPDAKRVVPLSPSAAEFPVRDPLDDSKPIDIEPDESQVLDKPHGPTEIPLRVFLHETPTATAVMHLSTVTAAEVIKTLNNFVEKDAVRLSAADGGKSLIIEAAPDVLKAIQMLATQIDRPGDLSLVRDTRRNPLTARNPNSGTPIGLPGPALYPARTVYARPATSTDPAAVELGKKYDKLAAEIEVLVKTYRETKDKRKLREIHDQIQQLTDAQFDLRQEARELEVERLKKRVQEVEGSVKKRKTLKGKIVERRVEDVLNGPQELQWEDAPRSSYYKTNSRTITSLYQPIPAAKAVGPVRSSSETPSIAGSQPSQQAIKTEMKYITRYVPRQVTETVTGADGKPRAVTRTVYEAETSKVPVTVPASPPHIAQPSSRFNAADSGSLNSPSFYANLAAGTTVSETEARVRIVERKLSELRHFGASSQREQNELRAKRTELSGDLEIAKLQLEQAKRAQQAARRLIELELRRATAVLEAAQAELDEVRTVCERVPGSIPKTTIRLKESAVEQAQIAVERVKTWATLHRDSNRKTNGGDNKPQVDPFGGPAPSDPNSERDPFSGAPSDPNSEEDPLGYEGPAAPNPSSDPFGE